MPRSESPEDLRITVGLLRSIRGWNQKDLAAASGMDRKRISLYEQGRKVPSRKTLERLAEAAGVPLSRLEEILELVRRIRTAVESPSPEDGTVDADAIARSVADAVQARLAEILRELDRKP